MTDPAVDESAEGAEGNTRLTSVVGVVLLAILAVEGYTVLDVSGLITLHIFFGMMMIGLVLLETAYTAYRFAKYYGGNPAYVAEGPPPIILRVLRSLVMTTSLTVLGTGAGLILWMVAEDS